MDLRSFKNIEDRRKFLEKKLKINFSAVSIFPQDLKEAQNRNCENMIGVIQIPLGVAGPVLLRKGKTKEFYYLPLATTEAALVASVNRGCKAICLSDGAKVVVENIGMTRGPVFRTGGIIEGTRVKSWLKRNFNKLAQIAKFSSPHLKLTQVNDLMVGDYIFVRFYFDTQEAMGMNMVTLATQKIVDYIEINTQVKCLSLAGNFDIDKKPAWLNILLGRGRRVWAEVNLTNEVVRQVLKTTPQKLHEVAINKCYLGSAVSGSMGFNAHFANIIAAFYLACGQDLAHVVEGSVGITATQLIDRNLKISVYLPNLQVGTVGGGTGLPSQKEALNLLGLNSNGSGQNTDRLAEIMGVAVLAGEISLLASLSEGSLAKSHQKLARRD